MGCDAKVEDTEKTRTAQSLSIILTVNVYAVEGMQTCLHATCVHMRSQRGSLPSCDTRLHGGQSARRARLLNAAKFPFNGARKSSASKLQYPTARHFQLSSSQACNTLTTAPDTFLPRHGNLSLIQTCCTSSHKTCSNSSSILLPSSRFNSI